MNTLYTKRVIIKDSEVVMCLQDESSVVGGYSSTPTQNINSTTVYRAWGLQKKIEEEKYSIRNK